MSYHSKSPGNRKKIGFITLISEDQPHPVHKTFAESIGANLVNNNFFPDRKLLINLIKIFFVGLKNINKYDVLIVNGVTGLFSASIIKYISYRKPELIYFDATPIFYLLNKRKRFKLGVIKKFFRVVDRYITVSELNKKYIEKVEKKRVDVVNPFFDLLSNDLDIDTITRNKNLFCYIGRFSREKNIINTIKAFKKFNDKYPDTKLKIAGFGKLEKDVLEEASGNRNIVVVGKLKHREVTLLLRESAYLFQLSVYDSYSVSVLESIYMKVIPLITANVGVADILDEKLIFSGKHDDIDGMVRYIETVYKISDNEKMNIMLESFERIKKFSKENQKRVFIEKVMT